MRKCGHAPVRQWKRFEQGQEGTQEAQLAEVEDTLHQ
jgi:hypothetical protein